LKLQVSPRDKSACAGSIIFFAAVNNGCVFAAYSADCPESIERFDVSVREIIAEEVCMVYANQQV
jgi:hypothetical protein